MENKITTVKETLSRIKDGLRQNRIEVDDINILLKLKDVPDELHEVIVLIHTYNKHSVGLIRNENEVLITDITNIIEKLLEMTEIVNSDMNKRKTKLISVKNIPYIAGSIALTFILIWLAYIFDKEATTYVVDIIGNTFSDIKKHIINIALKI